MELGALRFARCNYFIFAKVEDEMDAIMNASFQLGFFLPVTAYMIGYPIGIFVSGIRKA